MNRPLIAASLLAAFVPLAAAMAQDASPYVVGHWRLNDSFQDFKSGAAILTDNTDIVFLNPTNLTLKLEYAFFAPDGTFCGCDRDTLNPNGRTRYTMLGEEQSSPPLFSKALCTTNGKLQTEGELKSIVFRVNQDGSLNFTDALQAGVQIHIFGSGPTQRSESNLQGVRMTPATTQEMLNIHALCVGFLGPL